VSPDDEPADDATPGGERSDGSVAPDEVFPATAGVPEIGAGDSQGAPSEGGERGEAVEQPAKVLRIGSMVKQLLEEVRQAPLDEKSRYRLREIYEQSVRDLAAGLSPDLAAELDRMAMPFDSDVPSEAELRVAQAQLVGWLEGLFHGIQATLMAQQVAARAQLDEMRQRGLPRAPDGNEATARPGTYL
jgi:Bacterial proteasome activator